MTGQIKTDLDKTTLLAFREEVDSSLVDARIELSRVTGFVQALKQMRTIVDESLSAMEKVELVKAQQEEMRKQVPEEKPQEIESDNLVVLDPEGSPKKKKKKKKK